MSDPKEHLMGVIGSDGEKHCLFNTLEEQQAAVERSPLAVAIDLMELARKVGAYMQRYTTK